LSSLFSIFQEKENGPENVRKLWTAFTTERSNRENELNPELPPKRAGKYIVTHINTSSNKSGKIIIRLGSPQECSLKCLLQQNQQLRMLKLIASSV
jgi:hypothetical protein